jgi:tetratricopeptide (TPR) repeat protein
MVTSTPPVLHFVDNPLVGASFIRGRLTAIVVMAKYLWLLVWPLKLSSDYSYNQIPIASGAPHDWIAWIAVLAVIIAAASMYKRSPAAFFFAGFAFVCFIPVSNLLFLLGTIMAERFLYLPAIGFAGCLVMVTYWIGRRIRWRPFAPIALCLIITIFAIRTWERNFDWRDNVTFWTAAVRTAPNSFKVYDDLAIVLNDSDPTHLNINQIIEEVEKSLAILDPLPDSQNTEFAYSNAGQYYATKGDLLQHQEANGQMTVTPGSLRAYQRSLEILLRGVAIDKALSESQRKEKLGSGKSESEIVPIGLPLLYESLAMTYFRLGDNQEAYDAAAFARLLSPQYVNAYAVMGEALFAENRKEDAAISLTEGSLATGDPNLLRLLQNAYNSGIDPKGCSFMQTGNGPLLNNSCEVVHKDICKASSELIRVLLQDQQLGFADDVKNKALVRFECSADELQPRTNQ